MKLHVPYKSSHKGQNGKLIIIGGSKQYHGAPKFSILAARRFVDLIYFFPGEKDANLIHEIKKIPEVIVIDERKLDILIDQVDCVLFGIGLAQSIPTGSRKFNLILKNSKKLVIDGDGLRRIKGKIPRDSILTPHEGEFRMLFGIPGTPENVQSMAKKNHCVIVKKGQIDFIADGRAISKLRKNSVHNQGMTKGGTGDVLAGLISALACKNDSFIAAYEGTRICGKAGNILMKKFGYNFSASDLADKLSEAAHQH